MTGFSVEIRLNSSLFLFSAEDHHDGKQHDVPVRLRVPRAGENRLRGVWCCFQVREKNRWLHLRHQEIKETSGGISRRVSLLSYTLKYTSFWEIAARCLASGVDRNVKETV